MNEILNNTNIDSTTNKVVSNNDNGISSVISGNNNKISITSLVEDNSGGLSSMRVLMLLWGIIPLIIWSAGCIVGLIHGIYVFPTISPEVITVMLGLTGAKICQRPFEK